MVSVRDDPNKFLVQTLKNGSNWYTFAGVIAKLKPGYHFLDHPVEGKTVTPRTFTLASPIYLYYSAAPSMQCRSIGCPHYFFNLVIRSTAQCVGVGSVCRDQQLITVVQYVQYITSMYRQSHFHVAAGLSTILRRRALVLAGR